MIGALMGLPGKVKTLLDRLTATRAGYLDNLSAGAVAPAATALSTANWTNTRAGYLDLLPSIPASFVNSVQQLVVTVSNSSTYTDTTITSVNTNKSVIVKGGQWGNGASSQADLDVAAYFYNSTTVRTSRQGSTGNAYGIFFVLEFK